MSTDPISYQIAHVLQDKPLTDNRSAFCVRRSAFCVRRSAFGVRRSALKVLSPYDNVCVMGDLNIEDKVDGDIVLPFPWIDAWLSLPGNTDHNGLTWDRSKTPFSSVLKRTVNATSYKARLDRVLCKLSDFKVKEMRIVGDKLTKSGILPSDHFGLFTVLELSLNSGRRHNMNSQTTEREVYFRRPPGWENLVKPK